MADRISTRSASRRTTPQSPPKSTGSRNIRSQSPPQRTMRMTRSRSHDVSDIEASRNGAKKNQSRGAHQLFAEAVGNTSRSRNGNDTTVKPNNRPKAIQDLSTVTEHPSSIYPDLPISAENEEDSGLGVKKAIQRRNLLNDKSPSIVSVFSGTTARTSRSAQELLSPDPVDMLDALEDLSDASDKLLRLLALPDTSNAAIDSMRRDLKDPESRMSKNLRRLCKSFLASRDLYGSNLYIHIPTVLRALLGGERTASITYGPWRPDPLLQKANICTLLLTVFESSQKLDGKQAIEELEQDFPISFLHSFVSPELLSAHAGSSALKEDTFNLGLELRTQYAIILLTRYIGRPNFDPDAILLQVFYQEKNRLRGWDVVGLRAEELPKGFEDMIQHRLNLIRKYFSEEPQASQLGELVDIERVKAQFSWDDFVAEVVAWSSARLDELQRQINVGNGGGAENIKRTLELRVRNTLIANPASKGDATNVDESGPEVELNYDLPSERSQVPLEPIEISHRPATLANQSKRPVYSFNSPKTLSHVASHLKERFEKRPEPIKAQEAPMLPPIFNVAGTAPPHNHPLPSSKKDKDTTIASSAPVNMADELGHHVHIDNDSQFDGQSSESERDYGEVALMISQRQAETEAESNKENLAQGQTYNLNQEAFRSPLEQQLAETRKPRLIDRQPDAVRLTFDSQSFTQTGLIKSRQDHDNTIRLTDGDNEEEQIGSVSTDEGFQVDTRPNNANTRPSFKTLDKHSIAEPVTAVARPRKRVRSSNEAQSPRKRPAPSELSVQQRNEEDDGIQEAINQQNHHNVPQGFQIEQVNRKSKFRVAERPKKVQTRKAWTDQETKTLSDLIESHGTSWALLKEIDQEKGKILEHRDQVALKDKARNMKLDYLKAVVRLPRNFELIPLNKLQIERLRSQGIRYNPRTGFANDSSPDPTESDEE